MSVRTFAEETPFTACALMVVLCSAGMAVAAVVWGVLLEPGGHPSGEMVGVALATVALVPGSALSVVLALVGVSRPKRARSGEPTTDHFVVILRKGSLPLCALVFLTSAIGLGRFLGLGLSMAGHIIGLAE